MTLTASNLESHGDDDLSGTDPSDRSDKGGGPAEVTGKSPLRLAAARFRKDKLSMAALAVTALFLLGAIITPFLIKLGVLDAETFNQDLLDYTRGGIPEGFGGGISASHPLGVEPTTGRDVLSRLMLGSTLSLSIALAGAVLTVLIGVVFGIIAGFSGGIVDAVIGRVIDLTLAFPVTLMLLALSQVVTDRMVDIGVPSGPNRAFVDGSYVVIVLAAFGWPPVARLIRGQVLSIREREFVDAAILMGASRPRIYFKEILPNLWAPVLVYFTLLLPAFVSAEAALQFLGVGINDPTPTLGNVLSLGLGYARSDFVYFFAPAAFVATIVVAFNLLGDGVRDALDPKASR